MSECKKIYKIIVNVKMYKEKKEKKKKGKKKKVYNSNCKLQR